MSPLRELLRAVGEHRRWILSTALFGTLASVSGIGLVGFSAVLISRSALLSSTASLALIIVAVRFFATARVVLRYAERVIGHLATFRLLTRLRTWFFAAAIPIAPRGLIDRRTGELLDTILDDVDTMQDAHLRVIIPPIVTASTVLVSVIVLAASSLRSAAILLVIAALAAGALPALVHRRSRSSATEISEARSRSAAEVLESLEGARELIAFDALEPVLHRLQSLDQPADRARLRLGRSRGLGAAALTILATGCALLVTCVAIAEVRSGKLPGELLALLPLVSLATFESIAPLLSLFETRERSTAAARRISSIAEQSRDEELANQQIAGQKSLSVGNDAPGFSNHIDDGSPESAVADPPAGDLILDTLSFGYEPGAPVLVDVSCRIPAGSVVVITGVSGAGKSTLVDLLLRFDNTDGAILLGDVELTALDPAIARSNFAVVRQRDHIFDTTIRDNLALADPDADDTQLLEVLADAGLADTIAELPAGLDTRTGSDGSELSGGERQRLLIARALLADRPILILDEALEHLDQRRRSEVLDAVLTRRGDRTTIFISHDDPSIASPGLWLELRDGRLAIRA
jgi:thiol reductant ABC exporter CydC subunit